MTRFAPGSQQNANNPLAKRGSCCCCCSLRTGVIVLSILLMLKSVMLGIEWGYYSTHDVTYYNDYDSSDDSSYYWGHDNNEQHGGEGDHDMSQHHGDEGEQQPGQEEQEEQEGWLKSKVVGLFRRWRQRHSNNYNADDDDDEQVMQQDSPQGQGSGEDNRGVRGSDIEFDDDEEEEEEVDIPVWVQIVGWTCVFWHFFGGLIGTFAGCNYKRCCAWLFWMWWIITMTVSFGIGIIFIYFVGFDSCLIIAFTIYMAIGLYFTIKVKKYYNLLKQSAINAPKHAGYTHVAV